MGSYADLQLIKLGRSAEAERAELASLDDDEYEAQRAKSSKFVTPAGRCPR